MDLNGKIGYQDFLKREDLKHKKKKKKKKTRSSLSWKKMHIFFILITLTAPLINTRFVVKVILFPILSDG